MTSGPAAGLPPPDDDERPRRPPPVTWAPRTPWWPFLLLCAGFGVPMVAALVDRRSTLGQWLAGAVAMAAYSGFFLLLGWGFRRRWASIHGWHVTVRPMYGRVRTVDLRRAVRAKAVRRNDGRFCRVRLRPAPGSRRPRSVLLPLQPPFGSTLLSRLALLPELTARGELGRELDAFR